MHGRLKVKTTEEQRKAKEEERAKKLQKYTYATSLAFKKRTDGELNEGLLEVTENILQVNPDFYTLWNMRKETFLKLQEDRDEETLQKLYSKELDFLDGCLKVNPKSYGTWNHRCFVMDHMPKPNWARELELSNLFLQYDERNFHCWDYRRFVVKQSQVLPAQEFEFTTSKIESNFSNFSSWHYRSKLLPLIYPDPSSPTGIAQDVLDNEFDLVHNGMFTDPNDQSNWFYHRWLLGRGERKQQINYAIVSRSQKQILVSLTNAVKLGDDNCHVLWNGSEVKVRWCNQKGNSAFSTLWVGDLSVRDVENLDQGDKESQVQIKVCEDEKTVCEQTLSLPFGEDDAFYQWSTSDLGNYFRKEFSCVDKERLQTELELVGELQREESDNKWAMLTTVLLMKAVDPVSHQERIMSFLQLLQDLDSPRISYYKDLRSRFTVETAMETSESGRTQLSLKGENLTRMHRTELLPLVQELDLSCNAMQHITGFSFLFSLQRLNLSGNQLKSCQGLGPLPNLAILDLSNNLLSTAEDVLPLQTISKLGSLNLTKNPLCAEPLLADKLREILPSVEIQLR